MIEHLLDMGADIDKRVRVIAVKSLNAVLTVFSKTLQETFSLV